MTFSYASCAPVTSLPSAVTTSVYEQVSSLSPSETAIVAGNVAVVTTVSFLLVAALTAAPIVAYCGDQSQ